MLLDFSTFNKMLHEFPEGVGDGLFSIFQTYLTMEFLSFLAISCDYCSMERTLGSFVMDVFLGNPQLKSRENQFIFVCSKKGFMEETVVQKRCEAGERRYLKYKQRCERIRSREWTIRSTHRQVRMEKTKRSKEAVKTMIFKTRWGGEGMLKTK